METKVHEVVKVLHTHTHTHKYDYKYKINANIDKISMGKIVKIE